MKRRAFLLVSSLGVSSFMIPQLKGKQMAHAQEDFDVLVIGAGMAGLAAARTLQENGYTVAILEARDRIGGRLWTNRDLDGIPLDLGASWIHGIEENPLTELADEFGIERAPTDYDSNIVYDGGGEILTAAELATMDEQAETVLAAVSEFMADRAEDISLEEAIEAVLDLDPQAKTRFYFTLKSAVELEEAASASQLSAQYWDGSDGYGGEDVLFPQGYDQLAQRLAQGLDIRLGQVVERIEYGEDGVSITTQHGEFEADYAIVTVPLGVLKQNRIQFDPPLPAQKQAAIQKLQSGVLNKVYLQFPENFWGDEHEIISYIDPEAKGRWGEFLNIAYYLDEPILLAFNAGDFGLEIETWTDETIIADAMRVLRILFGETIPEPTAYLITRWGSDPFAGGSYSSYGVGATPEDRHILAETLEEVLFFAGEATTIEDYGYVHGAWLSGIRAAEELDEHYEE